MLQSHAIEKLSQASFQLEYTLGGPFGIVSDGRIVSGMSEVETLETPAQWDAASDGYSKKVAPQMMESFASELVETLDVDLDSEVLETAAGSGALSMTLAPLVKSLLSTDFSPAMVTLLQEKFTKAGISNAAAQVMDGQALELEDASVDRVGCSFALILFPNRQKGFSEMRRVLRPGGRAVVSAWTGPDRFGSFALFLAGMNAAFPDVPPPPGPPPVFSLADPDDFKAQMERGGFQQVETRYSERELTLDSFEELWLMMTVGAPPVKILFERLGPGSKERVGEALQKIVQERYGNGRITVTNTATIGTGLAPELVE